MDPDAVLETLLDTDFIAILPKFFYTLLYQKYGLSLKTSDFTNPISWQMDISANKENIESNEKFSNIFIELYKNLKTLESSC